MLLAGAGLGAFNGALVALLGLPSLVVTLGTMAMFRGIGYILLGSGSVNVFPDSLTNFGIDDIPGTRVPWVIAPFLCSCRSSPPSCSSSPSAGGSTRSAATPPRRSIPGSPRAGCASSSSWSRALVCAVAGMVYTARLANARANNALGMELDVITIVLLGGVSVWGGRGRLTGVLWALVLVALCATSSASTASAATCRAW